MPFLDKEEYLAWKDHPATRAVFQRHKDQADQLGQMLADSLVNSLAVPPDQWAAGQPHKALQAGHCSGVLSVLNADWDDLLTEDEREALAAKEKEASG